MVIMEDESSSTSDSPDSSFSVSPLNSVASTPTGSPSSSPSSSPSTSTSNCNSDSSTNSHVVENGATGGGGSCSSGSSTSDPAGSITPTTTNATAYSIRLRRRPQRQCPVAAPTTPPSPTKSQSNNVNPGNSLKSPPTPHKIQSLDEKNLRLDENYLAIVPSTKNGYSNHNNAANNAKPFNSTHQNKAFKLVDGENGKKPVYGDCPRRKMKLTDYFVQRRSNRKTQEAIKTEKHELLVKAILDGQQDGLMAKRFPGKGRGVVASKRFLKHEFVVEYAGELLTSSEARAREDKYAKDSGAGCYMYYFQYNNQQYCVDATKESDRLGRLINHSRNGNLVTKVVEVKGTPRLILIAKRDIDIDEELCYDYGDRSREALLHHPWLAT